MVPETNAVKPKANIKLTLNHTELTGNEGWIHVSIVAECHCRHMMNDIGIDKN